MKYVREYQKHNGLLDDGIIGPMTIKSMIDVLPIDQDKIASFLGQCAHETGGFTQGRENLNYSEKMLRIVFKRYFVGKEFAEYAGNSEKIANRVYANRMGNGSEESGDGWRYRGVGAIQLTGRANIIQYLRFADLSDDTDPDVILKPEHYFRSAKHFFDKRNLWSAAKDDRSSIIRLSKAINVGSWHTSIRPHGLDDRVARTRRFSEIVSRLT
ncbi:MAG: glycoside hydrolase family 19 protein [Methylomicrobium sp.]|nr:glycoside hydrolase family 19 protein [Methylomicrobium sp.]